MTLGPNIESALRTDGASLANGDAADLAMRVRASSLVFGHSFSSSISELELSRGVLNRGSDDFDEVDDDVVEFAGERPAMLLSDALCATGLTDDPGEFARRTLKSL
jgi:hypothetical protein